MCQRVVTIFPSGSCAFRDPPAVQGVSSADVARDVGLGVVSTLPTGYREQHTHFHSERVGRFVFWGWGKGGF